MKTSMIVAALVAVFAACSAVHGAPSPITMPLTKTLAPAGSRFPGGEQVEKYVHKMQSLGVVNEPVYGSIWPVSIFWMYLDIGTPPQKFPVAIDSGSFTLNVPVKGCEGCITKAPNNQYDLSASSTGQDYPCTFFCNTGSCVNGYCSYDNTYETCDPTDPSKPCSISGKQYQDQVSIGGVTAKNVTFGGISSQTSGFYQFETVDGVCGMASPSGSQSVFGSLVAQGQLPKNSWSICLHHGTTSNGTITLGGVDQRLVAGDFMYTQDVGFQFYSMDFSGMTVGGKAVSGLGSTVVIDSGTNDLLISQEGFDSMKQLFQDMCSTTKLTGVCGVTKTLFDGACFEMSLEEIAAFPDFQIQIPGITLDMTPKDYLLLNQPGAPAGSRCLGVGVIGGGLQIIGDTVMQNYVVEFDIENTRIGWAPVNTKTCGSL